MPNLEGWPVWLVAILLLINLFRAQLGTLLTSLLPEATRNWATRHATREKFQQQMELRQAWREEQWFESLYQDRDWIRQIITKEVQGLKREIRELKREIAKLNRTIEKE